MSCNVNKPNRALASPHHPSPTSTPDIPRSYEQRSRFPPRNSLIGVVYGADLWNNDRAPKKLSKYNSGWPV